MILSNYIEYAVKTKKRKHQRESGSNTTKLRRRKIVSLSIIAYFGED